MQLQIGFVSTVHNVVLYAHMNWIYICTTIDSYQIIEGRVSKIGTLLDCINARNFYFDADDDFQIGIYLRYVRIIYQNSITVFPQIRPSLE